MLKKLKLTLTCTLALILSLAGVPSAFAAGDPITGGTLAKPVQAAITKTLKAPAGTAVPAKAFTFTAKPISVNDDTALAGPALTNLSVAFTSNDTVTTDGAISSAIKETGNIFADVDFPSAGVYKYEITEQGTDVSTDHETLTYSKAKYTLTVYVKDDDGRTYVFAVSAVATTSDTGLTGSGDKVDPTPGGGGSEDYDHSQMIFTNTYVKTNGAGDPEDPDPTADSDSTLSISKMVTGEFGSHTRYFDYTLTLAVPSLVVAPPAYYRAYVVENNTVLSDLSKNADSALIGVDAGGSYIKISTTASTAFSLKHGQKLVFVDTPVGVTYSVTEAGTLAYLAKVTVTSNSKSAASVTGNGISAPVSVADQLVGEAANSADFVNDRSEVTPTGLNLTELPFIGMIVLALAALVVFIVAKSRRRVEPEVQA